MLPADEQRLFQQLSVFSGGWTLDAAEAVCESGRDVLPLLLNLVDKSLVQVDQHRSRSRFRLLETLRAYAANRLLEAGAESGVRNRHLRWCERLARDGYPGLSGPEHQEWLQRLEAEVDNFRAALRWSLDEPTGREAGLRQATNTRS